MKKMQFLELITLFIVLCVPDLGALNSDEVLSLPGLTEKINFRHYSGYLNASDGKFLHYWFVESQSNPKSDPVVLWMNGGPGCSSLDGFLTELGPFHVNTDGKTLYMNPYSWNKFANVIFLESPVGVGYSYSNDQDYGTDDDQVSYNNYLALQHFFQKFPEFRGNDFYVTGESYSGIYVPTLCVRLLNDSYGINFKGFAIGNGFLDVTRLSNSVIFFAYHHGLFSTDIWDELVKSCCNGTASRDSCNFAEATGQCAYLVQKVTNIVTDSRLNIYNIYSDCSPSLSVEQSRLFFDKKNLLSLFPSYKESLHATESPPCIDSTNVTYWLNQKSVRTALHIPNFLPSWQICSDKVGSDYKRLYSTMAPQILQLLKSGKLRGLIYNGDVDMACNFLGDEWFVKDLGLEELSSYSKWEYNGQIAGFVKNYENLSFVTIKGSGHMVPQDKPGPALKMILSFLYNKPY